MESPPEEEPPPVEESLPRSHARRPRTVARGCGTVARPVHRHVPRRSLVQQRILHGRGLLISGLGGINKTIFTYPQLAIAAVTGRLPWSWEISTTGSALRLLAEDTYEDCNTALPELNEARQLTSAERERFSTAGSRSGRSPREDTRLLTFHPRTSAA